MLNIRFLLLSLLMATAQLQNFVQAELRSTVGELYFDSNSDLSYEMTLNRTGLIIGNGTPSTNLQVQGNAIVSGTLTVGSQSSGSSNLSITGTMGVSVETVSANTTLSGNSYVLANSSSANLTLFLPYAGNVSGRQYVIKNISSHYVRVLSPGNTIDNLATLELAPLSSSVSSCITLQSSGSKWYILSSTESNLGEVGSDNLVAHWQFGGSSGNTVSDQSSSSNDLYLQSMTYESNAVDGTIDKSVSFTGNPDYGLASDHASLRPSQISFATWVKPTSTPAVLNAVLGTDYRCDGTWVTPWSTYSLVILTGGNVRAAVCIGGVLKSTQSSGAEAQGAVWTHCAGSYDGTTLSVYVNGALKNSSNPGGAIDYGSSKEVFLGVRSSYNTGSWFTGDLDDVRIYNRALNAEEVKAIYDAGVP
jgi:hypothetical protein